MKAGRQGAQGKAGMDGSAFYDDSLKGYLDRFQRDGFLVVPDLFEKARMAELLGHVRFLHPEYVGAEPPQGDHFEVGDRRFTAPLRYAPPFDCADFVAHPLVDALLRAMLGADFVLEAFGVISSLPGAKEQAVHRDGGPLFPGSGLDGLLPASAVAAAMPLVDMDETSGMTVFWPGSHRKGERDKDAPGVPALAPAGSLVFWDFRTFHNGQANRGETARPFLYLTACRPFWIDHRNFVPGKNAKLSASRESLDALDEATRARFIRADVTD
jgi:hypothetical protein